MLKHISELVASFQFDSPRLRRAAAAMQIIRAVDLSERFAAITSYYRQAHDDIMAAAPGEWGAHPSEVRWLETFTPIEDAMWHELRRAGLVFYPQWPVGRSFVDFGNPHHRIAIECDGYEFHLDKARDRDRDAELRKRGWRTYRISGHDCMDEGDPDDHERTEPLPLRRFVIEMSQRMQEEHTA